jgi:hypothetical protein
LLIFEKYYVIIVVKNKTVLSLSFSATNGKPDESPGRKAIGPLKWQPATEREVFCLSGNVNAVKSSDGISSSQKSNGKKLLKHKSK